VAQRRFEPSWRLHRPRIAFTNSTIRAGMIGASLILIASGESAFSTASMMAPMKWNHARARPSRTRAPVGHATRVVDAVDVGVKRGDDRGRSGFDIINEVYRSAESAL
jgi:hypothetical protein